MTGKKPTRQIVEKSFCVWSITYQETVNNELSSPEKFKSALEHLDPAGYVFQLETSKTTDRPHFQCNLRLKEKMMQSELRKALKSILRDFYGGGCMTIRPTHDFKKADFYCMKDDTRLLGPWLFPSDVYIGQDLIKKFLPWQEKIYHRLMQEPDDRAIDLICDPTGNKGKSLFAKTLGYQNNACVIPLGLTSAQMKSAIVSAGPRKIYVLDLPRNNKSYQEIFDTIEELKRGFVISCFHGKLKELYMGRPHIVCFTNEFPELDLLSFDMWNLYMISHSMELEVVSKYMILDNQAQNKKNKYTKPVTSSLVNK